MSVNEMHLLLIKDVYLQTPLVPETNLAEGQTFT
jgi:hypothetical protein